MSTLAFLLTQSANALSQAALLFFLGVGLTLIFGIMRIVNFAHGTFYMLGAFIGYSAARFSGSFWLALGLAPLAVGILGALFELGILRRLYRRDESAFLMVTFGLALVLTELIRLGWGPEALPVGPPTAFSGIVMLMGEPFPAYRLFLAGAGAAVALGIWQFLERTRLGLLIRATSQNAEMVHAPGRPAGQGGLSRAWPVRRRRNRSSPRFGAARLADLWHDAADRGADPWVVGDEPRPDGGLDAACFVRARRGLRLWRLCLRLD